MISVPGGTGDIPCGYDICCADDIRFAYEGTDIIMSGANNKVPGHPLEIFDFVSGSGSYIIFAEPIYHAATPHIISRQRYIIEKQAAK